MKALQLSQWLLLILGERALRIFEKYKEHPMILAFEATLVPAVNGYVDAYRAVQTQAATKGLRLEEGRTRVQALYAGLLGWLGMVIRDIPGFTLDPELTPNAPDRVIAYAENLLAVVQEHADRLTFSARLIENVTLLLAAARTDWEEAQQSLGQHQALQATVRERGAVLERELVAFRRTLRNTLGTRNRDYRLLRVTRDDDVTVEVEAETTEGTAASTTQPGTTPTPAVVIPAPAIAPTPAASPAPGNGVSIPAPGQQS